MDTIYQHSDLDIGDSIAQGSGTDQRDIGGHFGVLARLTRGRFGGINAGRSSTLATQFTAANRPRTIALAQYASRVKSNFGVNDCLSSAAAASTATELIRIRNLFPTLPFYQMTMLPVVTGATVLADGSDQTVGTPGTIATTLNGLIRAGLIVASAGKTPGPTITGVLDARNVVQHPLNEEKWAHGFCSDAGDPDVHPTGRAYRLIGETCPGRSALFN
ncbi:hypothetical protein BZG35_13240 [Brevundimonas sp. LM2]|uniref:SGNH/GDSL hydrolase family protein n=1 Tax=Brevundimonas sp. LM2 TaxID=1938605 RepID=UPI000983CBC9|nr:SGNH/GDSL hydrolase family protein [Brevundimonas sp. LM2]AQR62502.1 hypothetical protein BZG35_13240 [Brevundimonas sp. LM2]